MNRYLIVLLWPAGLAVIAGASLLTARRSAGDRQPGDRRPGHHQPGHHRRGEYQQGDRRPGLEQRPAAEAGRGWAAIRGAALLAGLAALGTVAVIAVMCLLGVVVTRYGPGVDRPVFAWVQDHQVHAMTAVMRRLTKIGDTWTTWGAAAAAAACLAVTWRRRRWVPPAALACLVVVDHYGTLALRHVFHRAGPPTSPLGTFPSGGCDRCVVFYGLIAYLLWREFGGPRGTGAAAAGVVAALGYNEAYSRVYLSLHWLTDALSGLVYGGLLLAVSVAAVRVVAGPAPAAQDLRRSGQPPPARVVPAGAVR